MVQLYKIRCSSFFAKRLGYPKPTAGMIYDSVCKSAYNFKSNDKSGLHVDYVRYRTLELLTDEIKHRNISGAVAELGVFRGDFSSIINSLYPESKLYLFDTFEGFNEKDVDYERKNNYTTDSALTSMNANESSQKSFSDTSIDIVLSKMTHPDKCIIRKGYFPETADGLEEEFIFVSIDCDLYLPILAGLEYFYPRLISGGYIMIHDYNSATDWKGVKQAVRDFENKSGNIVKLPITDNCGSLIIAKP